MSEVASTTSKTITLRNFMSHILMLIGSSLLALGDFGCWRAKQTIIYWAWLPAYVEYLTVFLPSDFAEYINSSAIPINSSVVCGVVLQVNTPTLKVTDQFSCRTTSTKLFWILENIIRADSWSVWGNSTANSSPPSRAMKSDFRITLLIEFTKAMRTWSPTACPNWSFTDLKLSRSM